MAVRLQKPKSIRFSGIGDIPGIRRIGESKRKTPELLGLPEHADTIRNWIELIRDELELAFARQELPFEFSIDRLNKMSDFDLCSNPGRNNYLKNHLAKQSQPPVITDVKAFVGARFVKIHRDHLMKEQRAMLNSEGVPQVGKTFLITLLNLLIAATHQLESDTVSRPLVLLPAGTDLEKQLKVEWEITKGLFGPLDIIHQKTGDSLNLETLMNSWFIDHKGISESFWLRRTKSDARKKYFLELVGWCIENKIHLILSADEADVGLGSKSLIVDWFDSTIPGIGCTLYDLLIQDRSEYVKLYNFSATLKAFFAIKNELAFNFNLPVEEKSYIHWRDVPRHELTDYASKYEPLLPLVGDTCFSPHNPCGDGDFALRKYVTHCLTQGAAGVRLRKANNNGFLESPNDWDKDEINDLCQSVDVMSSWFDFKNNIVPKIFARFLKNRLLTNNPDKKTGMVIRYVLKNDIIVKLIENIRKHISEDELILIPLVGKKDAFIGPDGNIIQHRFNQDQAKEAIRNAYELREIDYLSVPYVVMQTNLGRRGTQYFNDTIHLEFTKDPTTFVSLDQADGRCGGHKRLPSTNTELVVSELHQQIIIGQRAKKYSHHTRGSLGRSRSTEIIHRSDARNHCWLEEAFDWIDKNILNQDWQLKAFHRKTKNPELTRLMGGVALLRQQKPKVGNIVDIIGMDFFDNVEQNHETLFTERGFPLYKEIKFLRMVPNQFDQPKGEFLSKMGQDSKNSSAKELERYETLEWVQDNGLVVPFFPVGLRNVNNKTESINPNNRRAPYKQQIQIIYSYHKGWKKMICKGIGLRLAATPKAKNSCQPKPGTHPFNLTDSDQQKEWL